MTTSPRGVDALDQAALAGLIGGVPGLADALRGRGPLTRGWPWNETLRAPKLDPDRLRTILQSDRAVEAAVAGLDRSALQLAQLALWHGGGLERGAALAEVGAEHAELLDGAAATLAARRLTEPSLGWVVLREDVAEIVPLPGSPLRWHLDRVTTDQLARSLKALGVRPIPPRKAERIDALEAAVRDRATVLDVLADASEDAQRIFKILLEHGPQHITELGIPYYSPYRSYYGRYGGANDRQAPLDELVLPRLVAVDDEDVASIWLDVKVGLAGGALFSAWPERPVPAPKPLRGQGVGLPAVLHTLAALLDHMRAVPVPALASGGLGVRPVRGAAKALGIEPGEAGLLAHLAISLRLLGPVDDGTTGSGRQKRTVLRYAPLPRATAFADLDGSRQWALLVHTWRGDAWINEDEGLPERRDPAQQAPATASAVLARDPVLRLLTALPPGQGVELDELVALVAWHVPVLVLPEWTRGLVEVLRVLELVPRSGPIGLTDVGRAVLSGPKALEAALPPPTEHFVLQADRTAVAGPDLDARVAHRLARYAELESDAGARIWRLDETLVSRALDEGEEGGDVLAFLREHSSTGVPQNVEYLVNDVARRHGSIRLGAAGSYLRSDDAALLAAAVGTKAAKLRLLAPTVAVSPLETRRLLTVLRTAGVSVVSEDERGLALTPAPPQPSQQQASWQSDLELPDPESLARRILGGEQHEVTTPGARPTPPPLPDGLSEDPLERLRQRQRRLDLLDDDLSDHDDFEDLTG